MLTVKLGQGNRIVLPREAREKLGIGQGDRLLVDIQGKLLVLTPCPADFASHMAGLHREVWEEIDTTEYLEKEREGWRSFAPD